MSRLTEALVLQVKEKINGEVKVSLGEIQNVQKGIVLRVGFAIKQEIVKVLARTQNFLVFDRNNQIIEDSFVGVRIQNPDVIITGEYELREDTLRIRLSAIEASNLRVLSSITANVPEENIKPFLEEEQKHLSVLELQKIVADQNRKIEELRRQSMDDYQKQRMLKVIQEQGKVIDKLRQKKAETKNIPYTERKYDENLAFININSDPSDLDVYINGNWVGRTPLQLYEIEAEIEHEITVRGDPRFYDPPFKSVRTKYGKFQRVFEDLQLSKGVSQILLLSKYPIQGVWVNEEPVHRESEKALIEVIAGKHI